MKVLGLHPLLFYRDDIAVLFFILNFFGNNKNLSLREVQKAYDYLILG